MDKEVVTIDDEMLIKLSYVNISSYSVKVVKSLKGDVKIPTEIAKDARILGSSSTVSGSN